MQLTRRNWIFETLTTVLVATCSSCGTLLYPERRGQPAGRLDWKVVLLDGIGLILFFIPGVVAFAVDFLNGTIYLPAEPVPQQPPCLPEPAGQRPVSSSDAKSPSLRAIPVSRSQMTPTGIEKVIAKEIGKMVSLEDGTCVTQELESIDQFWEVRDRLDTHSLGRRDPLS